MNIILPVLLATAFAQVGERDCPHPLLNGDPADTNFIPFPSQQLPVSSSASCTFRCIGTMTTEEDVEKFSTMTKIISGVGLILALFVFITWGIFSVKSRQKLAFWSAFSSVVGTSFIFFPIILEGNLEEVWCRDVKESRRQIDGFSPCVMQGMALAFNALALCCWWWCSCFDLFTKFYRKKFNIQHYLFYYHLFSWGISSICIAAILFSGNFGYEQPRLWCFLSPEAPDAFEYVFFYGVIAGLWTTGTLMSIMTLCSVISKLRNAATPTLKRRYWKQLRSYKVPILFLFLFSIFWAILFQFVFWTDFQKDNLVDAAGSWFACLIVGADLGDENPATSANPIALQLLSSVTNNQSGCGNIQPEGLSEAFLTLALVCISGNGILLFIVFGVQSENYSLWFRWISSGFDSTSVQQNEKDNAFSISTFRQIRVSLAGLTIYLCEKCAGLEPQKRNLIRHKSRLEQAREVIDAIDVHEAQRSRVEVNHFLNKENSPSDPAPHFDSVTSVPLKGSSHSHGLPRQHSTATLATGKDTWDDLFNDPLWGVRFKEQSIEF